MIDFFVAEKSMVEYSSKMEPFATKKLLGDLHKKKINVRVLTTDRSGAIKNLMRDVNKERIARGDTPFVHNFDSWHFVKCVAKDLWKAAKLRKCIALGAWIRSVKNQIWYALASCNGNAELLIEMILAIPQHVAGIHTFPDNKHFKACHHGPLGSVRVKPWLKVGSLAWKKLNQAVRGFNDSRIKDLYNMTEFQHTCKNEQLNNIHNVYMPKHTFFGPPQARVRSALTVIDHNCNDNRPAKRDQDGDIVYDYALSRDGQTYTARPVKVEKNTEWRTHIMEEVVEAVRTGTVPSVQVPTYDHLKVFGKRRAAKPDKAAVVAATKARSRFRDHSKQ